MSEILNNKISEIPVNRIVAPTLNSAEYATTLGEAFENINDNFSLLANYDFIKGDAGSSVSIKAVNFTEIDGDKSFEEKLKEYIASTGDTTNITVMINGRQSEFSVWDNFEKNPGQLYMIYNKVNKLDSDTEEAISSLYYVFLDGRYANDKIGEVENKEVYNSITDLSCVVVYENGGFKGLPNAFPTIYYEKNIGLCWKVNGNNTGLPVQGIPGQNGINATIQIVKCNNVTLENGLISGKVNDIFDIYNGYRNVELISSNTDFDINIYDKQAAVVLVTDGNVVGSTGQGFYFGALEVRNNELYANCNTEYAINYGISTQTVINAMREINLLNKGVDGSSGMKGLFVPITETKEDGTQPVHLLSATSITNTEGQTSDDKIDVILTPVSDLEALNEINSKDAEGNEKHLQVDKYLYLKVNDKYNFVNGNKNINKNALSASNNILKYKLECVIKNVNDELFIDTSSGDDGNISMYFGEVLRNTLDTSDTGAYIDLSKNNTRAKYCNIYSTSKDDVYTDDYRRSIPKSFLYRLTSNNSGETSYIDFLISNAEYKSTPKTGIYQWRLCKDTNNFDIVDLSKNNYIELPVFNTIYTTTINPSISSEIMWFNGIENYSIVDEYAVYDTNQYVIPGWSNYGDIFEFKKFIPVFDNDFDFENDTALNINYNINVSGDENNPIRNVTVNGAINCDDLSVYNLVATGEIKNIYTKDDIVGDAGIKLGKIANSDEYNTVINSGSITTSGTIYASDVECNNSITADTTNTAVIKTNELTVKNLDAGADILYVGNTGDNGNDNYIVQIDGVNQFDICGYGTVANDSNTNYDVTVQTSNMPLLQYGTSNIVLSNQGKGSEQLYYYGVLTDNVSGESKKIAGDGVANNSFINNVNFDSAKNFNIHRVASSSKNFKTINYGSDGNAKYTHLLVSANSSNQKFLYAKDLKDHSANVSENFTMTQQEVANFSNDNDKYIQKIEIRNNYDSHNSNNIKFNRNNNISIKFNHPFVFQLGLYARCHYSAWPQLQSTSYMNIKGCAHIYNKNNVLEKVVNIGNINKKLAFTKNAGNANTNWYGYSANVSDPQNSKLLNEKYDTRWRYYRYSFIPNDINIQKNTDAYIAIANAYDTGGYAVIYIYPEFKIDVISKKDGSTSDWTVTEQIAISYVLPNFSSTLTTRDLLNCDYDAGKGEWSYLNTANKHASAVSYQINVYDENPFKSTTICNDGIVIRSDKTVFGIGYVANAINHNTESGIGYDQDQKSLEWNPGNKEKAFITNKPVLFYYVDSDTYVSNNKTDSKGYAKCTNVIPLEDIFNSIKLLRQQKTDTWEKFGL